MIVDRQGDRHWPAGTPDSKGGQYAPKLGLPTAFTDAQREALRMYSSWEYHDINRTLRQGRTHPVHTPLVETVRSAMAPTNQRVTAYRRASGKDFGLGEYPTTGQLRSLVGQTFTQPAFMSTTLDESVLAGHPAVVHMVVDVPEGTRAAWLHEVSPDHDQELLLDIGQRFELTSVEALSPFETIAHVRILPPERAALRDDVDPSPAWAEAVARSIARRIPVAETLDDVEPEYKPGRWQRLTTVARRQMYVQEMFPTIARMARKYQPDLADEDIRAQVHADSYEAVPEGAGFYMNGPHLVTVRSSRPVDQRVLLAEVDRLVVDYPPPGPLRMGVREAEFFARPDDGVNGITYGETITGTPTLGLSDSLFPDHLHAGSFDTSPGHKMPSVADVTGLRYVLTHEWGHVVTPKQTEQAALRAAFEVYGEFLSRYGQTSMMEAYAEAFAEWVLTRGQSSNVGVQGYAKRFGWKVPTHGD